MLEIILLKSAGTEKFSDATLILNILYFKATDLILPEAPTSPTAFPQKNYLNISVQKLKGIPHPTKKGDSVLNLKAMKELIIKWKDTPEEKTEG